MALSGLSALAACATSSDDGAGAAGGEGGAGGQTGTATTGPGGAGGAGGGGTGGGGTGGGGTGGGGTSSSSSSSGAGGGSDCGNGIIEQGESCEGSDFAGKTCADFGLSGGSLICNPFCQIVVSSCTPKESCNDGQDNDFDSFVDCADDECAMELSCTDPCAAPSVGVIPSYPFGDLAGEPNVLSSSCAGPTPGREAVFQVTAAVDGDLSITMYPGGFDGVISVRSACGDAASELACVNGAGTSQNESLSVPALAGEVFYVIFESTSPMANGFYNATIDQPLPETFCDDQWDSDFDGYLDCDDPTSCQGTFACTPGADPYGDPCFSNTECQATGGDPICLGFQQGFSNGYCSEFCSGPGDCGSAGVCVDLNLSVHGVCFKSCQLDTDCPAGLSCNDLGGGQKICDKAPELNCQDNQDNDADGFKDCEDPTACATSFSCQPGPLAAGAPCQIHNQCASNGTDPLCIDQTWYGWPGGYCSQFCDLGTNDCPTGSQCADWLFFPSGNGICLDECATQSDCRAGYFCTDIGLGTNVCIW